MAGARPVDEGAAHSPLLGRDAGVRDDEVYASFGEVTVSASQPSGGALDAAAALAHRLSRVLREHVGEGRRCVLLGFPPHHNVGDHAVWLGERRWLREAGHRVTWVASEESYAPGVLKRRLGSDGIVLLRGGGNLGDLWPHLQRWRERVITDFPDHAIVQLPQTLCFRDPQALARAQHVFNRHSQLTLLLRDTVSAVAASEAFSATQDLCPDVAFALAPLTRPGPAVVESLRLFRRDHESEYTDRGDGDWPRNRALEAAVRALAVLERIANLDRVYERVSSRILDRGIAVLSSARFVETDRLHAHILCTLLGIPHRLYPDRFGKLRGFYDSWTRDLPFVSWSD